MVDNRISKISKNDTNFIRALCDRKFGIGADGLILLENPEHPRDDFKMVYFNADGNESTMCGNGGRCIVAFARFLGIIQNRANFTAIDGFHEAVLQNDLVGLRMRDVEEVKQKEKAFFVDTGSPHHVIFTEDVDAVDVKREGALIRYSDQYISNGGTNVNFVSKIDEGTFKVRTYERGVEDETLSCGTGATAVALAVYAGKKSMETTVHLETPGGQLAVSFMPGDNNFTDVWLTGPAKQVFKGELEW